LVEKIYVKITYYLLNGWPITVLLYDVLQGLEQDKLEKLFFTHGFRVSFVQYDTVAKDIGLDLATTWEQCGTMLFVAEQLRFSDAQVSHWNFCLIFFLSLQLFLKMI
jgi:hypothetical protein